MCGQNIVALSILLICACKSKKIKYLVNSFISKECSPQTRCDQDQIGTIIHTPPLHRAQGNSYTVPRSVTLHSTLCLVWSPPRLSVWNVIHVNKTKLRTSDEEIMFFLGLFSVFSGRGMQEMIKSLVPWLIKSSSLEYWLSDCVINTQQCNQSDKQMYRAWWNFVKHTDYHTHASEVTQLLLTDARNRLQAKGGWRRADYVSY